ncbi:MAG: zinc-binding dehydrogenase, partial [Candidatus Marinimicrobia bacterium]|nr:zinc-binding dehydrogenase [Candidatus Neomarinimicrobiota bacterium]
MCMKAVMLDQYGSPDVLKVRDIEKPIPGDKEVLIKVNATSVNYGDLLARNFKNVPLKDFHMLGLFWVIAKLSFGLNKPKVKILGSEFSGVVESIGSEVTKFKSGEEVFGYLGQSMGAYAQYLVLSESAVFTHKPANVSMEEAAVLPYGAIMALSLLNKAEVKAGQKVLINGASGAIGSAAVQIAKHMGAEVTGVCSTPRTGYVRSLGADRVIDYTAEDFTQQDTAYDLVFDVLGRGNFASIKRVLTQQGVYMPVSFKSKQLLQMLGTSFSKN